MKKVKKQLKQKNIKQNGAIFLMINPNYINFVLGQEHIKIQCNGLKNKK
jgi:hypothetical protein